jgi:hypothetical protein
MDVPGLLRSVGIAAAGHPRVAEGRLGGPTLAPRNLSYLFDCRLVADAVEKVENRTTPKISQMVIFGLLRRCDASQFRYESPWSFF